MSKKIFVCSNCGVTTPRWAGQCSTCGEWNTLEESAVTSSKSSLGGRTRATASALSSQKANELALTPPPRIQSGMSEADRVWGGGIIPGSLTLLGGEPGIGKSTLTLQLAAAFAENLGTTLIASGEESAEQIAIRASRTNNAHKNLRIVSTNSLEEILATAESERPKILVVDSVQVLSSAESTSLPGSVPQIRIAAEKLLQFAKTTKIPTILIGHVTKDGELAGPRVLEHLVDVVLTLEGDQQRDFRILRGTKNRFGSTNEVGIFEMLEDGLREVANPSESFLSGRDANAIGSCIATTLEGTRPILVEVQALTAATNFGYPRRTASGFDTNRLHLILAVLQRHAGIKLESSDVFVNVVGGMKIREPAADLAVALAIASSKLKKPLPNNLAAFGEVGLTGEVRSVSRSKLREAEAKKLGYKEIVSAEKFHTLAEIIAKIF